jgi:hypothetical protein
LIGPTDVQVISNHPFEPRSARLRPIEDTRLGHLELSALFQKLKLGLDLPAA